MRVRHHSVCSLLALLAFAGASPTTCGNGMRLVSQDAFAAARGEAFVATADNPSAIYYNPAGLTQLEGMNLRGGVNGLYLDPTFVPPPDPANSDTTYHIENKLSAAPQLYATCTWKTVPITAGIGVYAPYGAAIQWPQDTGFRSVALEGSLLYVRMNPVVAIEVLPNFSLAAGLQVDYADLYQEQGLFANYQPDNNYFRFEGDGWSLGYNLGLLWNISDNFSFGATFRSPAVIQFEGSTETLDELTSRQPKTVPAHVEYEFPLTAVFGVSYRPTPRWNLEVNLDYTDWSSFDSTVIHQEEPTLWPVPQDLDVTLHWKASWIYSFGVTHYFNKGWHVSGGYAFNQNSVPDDYYSPLVADLDRHILAAGVGRQAGRFSFDVTYQFAYGPERVVVNSKPPSLPGVFSGENGDGTYEWISHAILLSVGFRF